MSKESRKEYGFVGSGWGQFLSFTSDDDRSLGLAFPLIPKANLTRLLDFEWLK